MAAHAEIAISEDTDTLSKYDPELRFRRITGITARVIVIMTLILSIFHIYTAGFGVLQEWRHRAFHLAFVLPLVFFLYAIRKGGPEGKKYVAYDLVYTMIGSSIVTALLREILELSSPSAWMLFLVSGLFIFYFKRRAIIVWRSSVYLDLLIFSGMIGSLFYGAYHGIHHVHFETAFRDPNFSLVFWSVLLFGIFLSIIFLFVVQWMISLWTIAKGLPFRYNQDHLPYFDVFFALTACLVSVYIFLEFNSLVLRAGLPSRSDLIVGGFAILLVLEGARRSVGPALPFISYLVLLNAYLGPYFLEIPGLSFFAHRGYSAGRIIEQMYLGTEGIYGIPLGVVATFVFHFVLFGIFISKTGLGQLFVDAAMALAGWSTGGPAKVAVVSSGFMGSISGSSVANTVTTGSFTIPLMRRVGYSAQFAGAVEASASTGGQIMPPIMGAAAFIMAEFLGIPYIKIAACAIVPAFLYFFGVGFMVHLEAKKQGLIGLPRTSLPNIWGILKERWLLVGPLFIIVYLLISGSSPFLAAFWGIILSVSIGEIHRRTLPLLFSIFLSVPSILLRLNPLASFSMVSFLWGAFFVVGMIYAFNKTDRISWGLSFVPFCLLALLLIEGVEPSRCAFWTNMAIIAIGIFYKKSKMRIPEIMETLELGTKNAIAIGAACACIGFIVGATTLTGLGLKFAAAVIRLSEGVGIVVSSVDFLHLLNPDQVALFFTLIFAAISCFILGMGIPTTAQYIIASMIAAPALLQWGIQPLVSHMFVFYFAILADVTPPVALAAYAASGISGANPFRTGFTAFGLASAGFLIPFVFVSAPVVLWLPTILDKSQPFDIAWFLQVLATLFMGVIALGTTIIGYLKGKSTSFERMMTGLAAACLIVPGTTTDITGFLLLVAVYLLQHSRQGRTRQGPENGSFILSR